MQKTTTTNNVAIILAHQNETARLPSRLIDPEDSYGFAKTRRIDMCLGSSPEIFDVIFADKWMPSKHLTVGDV